MSSVKVNENKNETVGDDNFKNVPSVKEVPVETNISIQYNYEDDDDGGGDNNKNN